MPRATASPKPTRFAWMTKIPGRDLIKKGAKKAASLLPGAEGLFSHCSSYLDFIRHQRIGEFQLENRIHKTAMSQVYRAFEIATGKRVIVKLAKGKREAGFIEKEGQILKQVPSQYFPHFFEAGTCGSYRYIIEDEIQGETIRALLNRKEEIPLHQAIELVMQVCYGLEKAHNSTSVYPKGIIHRDIKPENIMKTHDNKATIIDFGFAVPKGYEDTEFIAGTDAYLSPEQARRNPVDGRSDLYSLGIIFYEMITQKNPMRASTNLATIYNQANKNMPTLERSSIEAKASQENLAALQQEISQVHTQLDQIIRKMTAKDPNQRFQNAQEVIDALQVIKPLAERFANL
ncbi:MAG: serine/threonine protein kinase [Candidatus Margulisbacteria bacterium]|nr:serine/threonine protein kinase [Candidatus Margulisiibacteriota bacterium]